MRILLVEDTDDVGDAICARLQRMGHAVDRERDGGVADEVLAVQSYDLVLLDVMLPGIDGVEILRRLRARGSRQPVLVLTARSAVDDRVTALDLGADDYLVKPFDCRELEARVRALLRRPMGSAVNELRLGALVIDRTGMVVTLDGRPVPVTRREFAVLEALAARPGRIVGKEELIDRLFGFDDAPSGNAVEQYVARLRRKLEPSAVRITTLRNLGYRLDPA